MSSITKSAGNTLVAMLATVSTSANTVTRSVHTVASGLDMLDQYVQDARREQIARSKFAEKSMLNRIREDAAKETAQRRDDLQHMLASSSTLKAHFETAYNEFEETAKQVEAELLTLTHRSALIGG